MNAGNFYKTEQDMKPGGNVALRFPARPLSTSFTFTPAKSGLIIPRFSWVPGSSKDMTSIDNFGDVLLSDNQNILNLWNRSYVTILRSNIVLDKIDAVTFRDEKLKNQYKAEARFPRALVYFWLVRIYGDVPKIDKTDFGPGSLYLLVARLPGRFITSLSTI